MTNQEVKQLLTTLKEEVEGKKIGNCEELEKNGVCGHYHAKEIYHWLLMKEAELGINLEGGTDYFLGIDDAASYVSSLLSNNTLR